jgi:hypothetical protein
MWGINFSSPVEFGGQERLIAKVGGILDLSHLFKMKIEI